VTIASKSAVNPAQAKEFGDAGPTSGCCPCLGPSRCECQCGGRHGSNRTAEGETEGSDRVRTDNPLPPVWAPGCKKSAERQPGRPPTKSKERRRGRRPPLSRQLQRRSAIANTAPHTPYHPFKRQTCVSAHHKRAHDAFYSVLVSPRPGGPAGSGLSFPQIDREFWADSGPDPGEHICYFHFGLKRSWVMARPLPTIPFLSLALLIFLIPLPSFFRRWLHQALSICRVVNHTI
jgi:hypothetical protein